MNIKKYIRQAFLVIFIILSGVFTCYAQHTTKYELGFLLGFEHTLAQRGPKYKTPVSEVKFLRPISKTLGGMFDVKHGRRFFYGIEFLYDEFDYGFLAEPHDVVSSPGLSIASGDMHADDRVALIKSGIRIGYRIYNTRKFHFNTLFIPSVGYYQYSQLLNDTTDNSFGRSSPNPIEIQYNGYPPYQREGLYFLLKGTIEFQYDWNKHFATSFMFSYQHGFTPFVIDTINIVRPYELTGPKEHKYWTKVNGTALQWHFGFKYTF